MIIVEQSKAPTLAPPPSDALTRRSHEVSAWQVGVDRYLATLPPEVKQAFKAPASADDCLRLLQTARTKNRKFDRLVAILQPLIDPLKRFESSIDTLVQTYSSVACPVWGPLKVLITIASTRLSTLHHVVTLLERLVEPLRRFHNYEQIFRQNAALRQAIGSLYCDLIEFCTRLVAHESKSPLKKTFASFDKDVAEISDNIRFHWAEVDVAANAANLVEAKLARTKEDLQRAYEFQRDVNRWLAPATVQDDLERLSSLCAEDSCRWIMESSEMKDFMESKKSTSLRLCSWPGGGKSVAASFLVKQLQDHSDGLVLYFFCRATDAEKSFTTSILRTLVWQLLQIDTTLFDQLAPIYNRSGRQIADSEVLVFEMFDTVTKHTLQSDMYVVIDALDECYDSSSLLSLLTAVQSKSHANFKLMLTSRDDPDSTEQLSFCNARILLQNNQQPLEKYVSDSVEELALPVTRLQREDIRLAIQTGSGGLWLFAKLMMDEIRKASSIAEIYEQIQTVPDGIAQLYNSILRNREKEFIKSQVAMAQQVFLWIRVTDYMPQELWKAQGSNGLDDEVINTVFQYLTKTNTEIFKPMELILRLCSPLITTRLLHEDHLVLFIDGKPIHCQAFVAEFFHQTADQYLHWCSEASLSQIPASMQPRRLAALHRGACAVWYFGESEHFQHTVHHLQERPRSGFGECWLEMACGLWQALSLKLLRRDLGADEVDEAQDLMDKVISFLTTDKCLSFVEASFILHYSGQCTLLGQNIGTSMSSSTLALTSSRGRLDLIDGFVECCDLFKADLLYTIARFPASLNATGVEDLEALKPEGFEKRPRARKVFTLARRYRYLTSSPQAVSSNGFLMSPKF